MALISISASGEVILVTSTIVEAGSGSLKYSRRTRWIPSNCSMLRRKPSTRQISSFVPPAASTAAFRFSQTCRVWASMSPTPSIVPSSRRAVMPEMKTSRPFASIIVACENTPLGWRSLSDRICVLGMIFLPSVVRPLPAIAAFGRQGRARPRAGTGIGRAPLCSTAIGGRAMEEHDKREFGPEDLMEYKPGDVVPKSGAYRFVHDPDHAHAEPEEINAVRG